MFSMSTFAQSLDVMALIFLAGQPVIDHVGRHQILVFFRPWIKIFFKRCHSIKQVVWIEKMKTSIQIQKWQTNISLKRAIHKKKHKCIVEPNDDLSPTFICTSRQSPREKLKNACLPKRLDSFKTE